MNKKPKTSVLFILLGGVVVIFMLFPTFLPGADSAFGPVQTGLTLAGFGLIVFGFDLGSQPGEGSMDLWHFIRYQARVYIPWFAGSILYALVIIISPRFFFIQENIQVLKVAALFLFFCRFFTAFDASVCYHSFKKLLSIHTKSYKRPSLGNCPNNFKYTRSIIF